MDDICNTCALEDACPSAHFHPTGKNYCADYRSMKKDGNIIWLQREPLSKFLSNEDIVAAAALTKRRKGD